MVKFTEKDLMLLDCVVTSQIYEIKSNVSKLKLLENPANYQKEQLEIYDKLLGQCERVLDKIKCGERTG